MEFAQPPPSANANFAVPPPPVQNSGPSHPTTNHSPGGHYQNHHREHHFRGGYSGRGHFRSYNSRNAAAVQDDFDGKRLRKSVMRKTVDYNSSIVREIEVIWWNSTRLVRVNEMFPLFFPAKLQPYRAECGSETVVTDVHYNRKVFMWQTCYRHPVTWTIQ